VSGIYLDAKEFLEKIRTSDVAELVENFTAGRFELYIRANDREELYLSPSVYKMPSTEDMRFVTSVERAIERKDTQIRRSQKLWIPRNNRFARELSYSLLPSSL
jgi:hypothetical protein